MINDELFININELPAPLSNIESCNLIKKYKTGDKEAYEKLIRHNIKFVIYQVLIKFRTVNYDKKDLVSVGNIGLMKAINTFDPAKNIEFLTYAVKCINNEIKLFLRKLKFDKYIDSFESIIWDDESSKKITQEKILCSEINIEEEYTDNETIEILRNLVENLSDNEKKVIMMRFGFYNDRIYTQQEIAEKINVSQSYASRLIRQIVDQLGNTLEEQGVIERRNKKQLKPEF